MVDIDKCCITRFPEKVLSSPAKPIEEVNDNIRQLADKMVDIMIEQGGVGLAGPQAGVGLRIFVASVDATRENARVYINPKIETSGSVESIEEGCLSLPNVYGKIKRYKSCTITATGLDGKEFTEEGHGLQARIFQHEYDHLEGTMIKDKLGRIAMISARKHLNKLLEEHNSGKD